MWIFLLLLLSIAIVYQARVISKAKKEKTRMSATIEDLEIEKLKARALGRHEGMAWCDGPILPYYKTTKMLADLYRDPKSFHYVRDEEMEKRAVIGC